MSEEMDFEFDFDMGDMIDVDEAIDIEKKEEEPTPEPELKDDEGEIKKDEKVEDLIDLDEELEKEEEEEDKKEPESTKETASSSAISAFVSALVEEGAFPDISEDELKEIKSAEDLIKLNLKQIKANELKDLTPLQKQALESFRNGISVEDFVAMKQDELNYDSIQESDLEDLDKAKNIVSQYLKLAGTPDDVAKDLIESYDVDEKLTEKAKAMLPKIKDYVKKRNEDFIKQREQEKEEAIKSVRKTIDETKEIFKGVELTKKEKDELFEQMKTPVEYMEDGTPLDLVMVKRKEDPMGFMVRLHYYAKRGLFDKDFDMSFLAKPVKKAALSKLEQELERGNSHSKPKGRNTDYLPDDFDIDEIPEIKIKY